MDYREIEKLINSFDTQYYIKKIAEYKKRIENVEADLPEYSGIYNDIKKEKKLTPSEKEKRIKWLKKCINDNEKQINELNSVILSLKTNLTKVKSISNKDAALYILQECIWGRRRQDVESELDLKDMYKKVSRKLYYKSKSKLRHATNKINKEVYKMLKSHQNLRVTEFENIKGAINHSGYSMETLMSSAESQYSTGYSIHNGRVSELGIDIDRLNYAKEAVKNEPSEQNTSYCENTVERLKYIKRYLGKNYDLKISYSKLRTLREKYNEIVLLAREIWYMDEIIWAFRQCVVKDTEMYKGLIELCSEQKEKLIKLQLNADKLYDSLGVQNNINAEKKLNELYNLIKEKELMLENYKKLGNIVAANTVQGEIFDLRFEMIKILRNNPEFNRKEYNIDIEKIIEQENEIYKPEAKKSKEKDKGSNVTIELSKEEWTPEQAPRMTDDQKKEEKNFDKESRVTEKTKKEEIELKEKTESLNITELGDNLHIHRTSKYQSYMREKVIGSELGKITFSQYLEQVAPYLTELIKIEKEREKQARNIYRNYIRYYASLPDKTRALTFEEFANENYGIDNIDVPIECEEEYKGMIKK